jgi:hypothetical protein
MDTERSQYLKLLNQCKQNKVKVKLVGSRKLADYAGMNDEAAKKLGYRKLPNKTILIDRNLSVKTKKRTLKHELIEMNLMEKKHMPYWVAHKIALKRERL